MPEGLNAIFVLQFAEPEEPYILIMDSDIIMRRPYVPDEHKVRPGVAVVLLPTIHKAIVQTAPLLCQSSTNQGDLREVYYRVDV